MKHSLQDFKFPVAWYIQMNPYIMVTMLIDSKFIQIQTIWICWIQYPLTIMEALRSHDINQDTSCPNRYWPRYKLSKNAKNSELKSKEGKWACFTPYGVKCLWCLVCSGWCQGRLFLFFLHGRIFWGYTILRSRIWCQPVWCGWFGRNVIPTFLRMLKNLLIFWSLC